MTLFRAIGYCAFDDVSSQRYGQVIIEIHICIFNKMQKTGFKHKYPTIEFNSENPKKRVLMNVSVYVKRHEYFKEWMTQLVIC